MYIYIIGIIEGKLDWTIYFWIGHDASTDKRTCAAIHAVNLKAHLDGGHTVRVVQGDEPPDLQVLLMAPAKTGIFEQSILYIYKLSILDFYHN